MKRIYNWSGRQGSNLRPDAPKAPALPPELLPDILYLVLGGSDDSSPALPSYCQAFYMTIFGLCDWCAIY